VRPPTKAPEELAKFSEQAWPQWSVKPGELTLHGAKAMALMGSALKQAYIKTGLLAQTACPSDLYVWSDSADQRTRASGDAIMKGFGCEASSAHLEAGKTDPLIDPIEAGICPIDPEKGKAAAEAKLSAILTTNVAAYKKARLTMQSVLTPNGCGKDGQRDCLISEGEDKVSVKDGEVRLTGPLREASTLSENFLLEHSEGKPLSEVGWGRASAKLDVMLTLHNLYADLMRREPYFASRRGSLLAQQVVDLLNNKKSTFQGSAPVPETAKLVIFVGHDTNLSNMAGFLGTGWKLSGQPDHTAPGTAIAFERWARSDGKSFVRVRLFYQTLNGTRALTPGAKTKLLAVCPNGQCSLPTLSAKIIKNVSQDCLK
jgi:4-phytase/acid phosphatase